MPAAKARDRAALEASYKRLSDAYAKQRAMVDKTVTMATSYQTALKERSAAQLRWAIALLCIVGAVTFLLVGAAYFGLQRRIIRPLANIVDATTSLAAHRDVTVPHLTREDELGALAKAVEGFRLASIARAAGEARQIEQELVTASLGAGLAALKKGDLTRFIEAEFPPAYASLKTDYNEAPASLGDMIRLVNHSAGGLSLGTQEIALAASELAQRTESNAATLEQTNAALGQISERLKTTSASSLSTVQRTDQAIGTVANGRNTARDAVSAMGRVSGSAQGIDSVIEGLDKIAFQTRVLAMNAAVEAGRAGQAGLGFSVVADLVSALAKRAEDEAKRARDQLTATQIEITTAMDAVTKVDGALEAIADNVAEVNVLVLAMATDNQAQSLTVSEISKAVSIMDESTQQNAAMVEQTSAATQKLTSEVRQLEDHAAAFTLAGGKATGRAAMRSGPRLDAKTRAGRVLESVG
ncbi:methyl-accepting chemotaxis protein [Sphingomonas sp. MMS24-J45]|uniref:methyl-accepting chemotaxis protein n=1 Tax=Sphingomonas sp. MMS24-J45 TaxID=3238806 RepID=UPI00384D7DC4